LGKKKGSLAFLRKGATIPQKKEEKTKVSFLIQKGEGRYSSSRGGEEHKSQAIRKIIA